MLTNPVEDRNEKLAQTVIRHLRQRHFDGYYCKNVDELKSLIKTLIPEKSSITWGGSVTVRSTGINKLLKEGNYTVYDRDDATTDEEKQAAYLKAFSCDYYLSSVNAMTEDGQIVNIDGNGNRVAALTWGPKHVVYIVGFNKICQDLDAAVKRARSTAAPVNAQRFNLHTPCKADGVCHNCQSPDSICNYIWIQRLSPNHRHTVILVAEDLGY